LLRIEFKIIVLFLQKKEVINYAIYKNENSKQWVTFVHGAGGSSYLVLQIRDFKTLYCIYWICGVTGIKPTLKTASNRNIPFRFGQ
jgi:hypothetical protein